MNSKKDCCAQCYGRMGTLAGGGTYCQVNREGCCHTDNTKKCECVPSTDPAWNYCPSCHLRVSQGKESSEKDASYYYQEGYTDGYSAGIEDGKEESSNLVQPESKEIPHSSSSFTEKTIENFREEFPGALWMSMKGFGDVNLRPRLEQWLTSKLEEAQEYGGIDCVPRNHKYLMEQETSTKPSDSSHSPEDANQKPSFVEKTIAEYHEFLTGNWENGLHLPRTPQEMNEWLSSKLSEATQDVHSSSYDFGVKNERQRILSLIENKKKEIEEEDSEAFGWELLDGVNSCCPGDDAAYGYEKALTSLIEEITKNT